MSDVPLSRLTGTMRFRMSWDVLSVPADCTVELEDGHVYEGPLLVEGPPRIERLEDDHAGS